METKEEVIKKLFSQGYNEEKLLYFVNLLYQKELSEDTILEKIKMLIIKEDERFSEIINVHFGSRLEKLDRMIEFEEALTHYNKGEKIERLWKLKKK